MKRALAALLVRLYPRAWRDQFGSELQDLLEAEPAKPGTLMDVARAAASEQLFNSSRLGDPGMQSYPASVLVLARKPSAFIPLVMSLCAIIAVLAHIAIVGTARQRDEDAAAHIFQLMIAGQLPILAFFAVKWLSQNHKAALSVIALQIVGIGVALAPVWYLRL